MVRPPVTPPKSECFRCSGEDRSGLGTEELDREAEEACPRGFAGEVVMRDNSHVSKRSCPVRRPFARPYGLESTGIMCGHNVRIGDP